MERKLEFLNIIKFCFILQRVSPYFMGLDETIKCCSYVGTPAYVPPPNYPRAVISIL
jgi:hypothetical protein